MNKEFKLLSFIISIKRYKKNSILLKGAVSEMAKKLEIHPETFKKYLKLSLERKYIVDKGNRYLVVSLPEILRDFSLNTSLVFMQHEILKNRSKISLKSVLQEVQGFLVIDNIINQQEYAIKKKKEKIEVYNLLKRTDKSYFQPRDVALIKKNIKKADYRCAENIENHLNYKANNITSARHVSGKLGISVMSANKLLHNIPNHKRKIVVKWIHGATMLNFELARIAYPKATVIPMLYYNKIKVCFGSNMENRK